MESGFFKGIAQRLIATALLAVGVASAKAQDTVMADAFREEGKIYVVIVVIGIIVIGLALNMWRLDKKVGKIEKELEQNK